MSEPSSPAVECPICGEGFDPAAAGGWCTNPECGEWQYLGEEVPEPDESSIEEELDDEPDQIDDADDATAETGASPSVDSPVDEEATAEPTDSDASPVEAEATGEAMDSEASTAEAAETDDEAESPADAIEFTAEPGESADDTEADAQAEAADDEAADAGSDPERPGEADLIFKSAVELEESDEASIDAVCPSCGESVDVSDNFCPDCGTDLHEPSTADCPECGAEVDPDDAFCGSCGADLDGESVPDRLALRARGQEVLVTADQTVGREIRRLLTDTGGAEDEAVRIHREHVRIIREDGQFYLVDLGDNPTEVNGHRLSKGDREPIGPGDEIGLSGVVTLSVGEP